MGRQLSSTCLNPTSTALVPLLLSHSDYPASVHSRDNHGDTPLHHASAAGSLKTVRVLLAAGADPMAKNAYDWTPLSYSQTVAAEVYFKNLVAELERRRIEGAKGEIARKEERIKRRGAGVRLVTGDDEGIPVRPSQELEWNPVERPSPVDLKGSSFTPTIGQSGQWTELWGTRARASSDY